MAFLPGFQEPTQATTQTAFSSWLQYPQMNYEEESTLSSLSVVLQDSQELKYFQAMDLVSRYSLMDSRILDDEGRFVVTSQALTQNFYEMANLWGTRSSVIMASQSSQGKGVSNSISKYMQSKIWGFPYSIALNLQDLSVERETREARNALVYGLLYSNNLPSLLTLPEVVEVKEDLGKQLFLVTAPSKADAQFLEQLYSFRKTTETLHFLEKNSFLVPLLRDAYYNIHNYFPYSELFLEVVADPEAADEKQLVVFIAVKHKRSDASLALDQLDEDWWLDAMERAQDKLCITLEFQ